MKGILCWFKGHDLDKQKFKYGFRSRVYSFPRSVGFHHVRKYWCQRCEKYQWSWDRMTRDEYAKLRPMRK